MEEWRGRMRSPGSASESGWPARVPAVTARLRVSGPGPDPARPGGGEHTQPESHLAWHPALRADPTARTLSWQRRQRRKGNVTRNWACNKDAVVHHMQPHNQLPGQCTSQLPGQCTSDWIGKAVSRSQVNLSYGEVNTSGPLRRRSMTPSPAARLPPCPPVPALRRRGRATSRVLRVHQWSATASCT